MKKILFVTLPLKGNLKKCVYPVDGNALLEIKEPIQFAATAALANSLKADDEVIKTMVKPHMLPAEMEMIKLNKSLLKEASNLTFEVKED